MTARTKITKQIETVPRGGTTRRDKLVGHLKKIASEVEGCNFLSDAPDQAMYVPTLFPSFNRAIQLGGAPVRCIWLVHGPTAEGKSTFCAGLVAAFQQHGHMTGYIDAEHGILDKQWFTQLGVDPKLLLFNQPEYIEDASDLVDGWIGQYDQFVEEDPDLCFLIVLDSLSKFVPRAEFKRFCEDGADALDKGLARTRGLYLQAWIDHLTPMIGKRNIALVCIGQERMIRTTKIWEQDYRIKGVEGATYDASVRMRIKFGPKVRVGSDENSLVVGQKHNIYVFKNRVGYPNEMGAFYTSNGKGQIPIGFDYGREMIDEGVKRGIIQKAGAWYAFDGEKLGQGIDNASLFIHQHPNVQNELRMKLTVKEN